MSNNKPLDKIIIELQERAKELNCLYRIQELLNRSETIDNDICKDIIELILYKVKIYTYIENPNICNQNTDIANLKEIYKILSKKFNELTLTKIMEITIFLETTCIPRVTRLETIINMLTNPNEYNEYNGN